MAKNIIWRINSVDVFTSPVNNLEKVIKSCRWSVYIEEDVEPDVVPSRKYTAETDGYFEFDKPSAENFIPFDQLTNETVLNWVWTRVDKTIIENTLSESIEKQRKPETITTSLPHVLS